MKKLFISMLSGATVTVLFAVSAPQKALAIGAPTAAALGGVQVVLQVIEGATNWIAGQLNDTQAYAFVKENGKHGGQEKSEKDNGFLSATAGPLKVTGLHGEAEAKAYAKESLFGAWAGFITDNSTSSRTFPLHQSQDNHNALAAAVSSVDDYIKAEVKMSTDARIVSQPSWRNTAFAPPTRGDVFLAVAIPTDSFLLEASTGLINESNSFATQANWNLNVKIDGVNKFASSVVLDGFGNYNVSSSLGVEGLSLDSFKLSFVDEKYKLLLRPNALIEGVNYHIADLFVENLYTSTGSDSTLGIEKEYLLSANEERGASASIAAIPGPLPLLGVAAAFGYSRKLRKRIKGSKSLSLVGAIG